MKEFGITSSSPLDIWYQKYREGGAEVLRPKPKNKPKDSGKGTPMTREQELEHEVKKLETQVTY